MSSFGGAPDGDIKFAGKRPTFFNKNKQTEENKDSGFQRKTDANSSTGFNSKAKPFIRSEAPRGGFRGGSSSGYTGGCK